MGNGGRGSMARLWEEVRMWVGRSVILFPSEVHTNPLPLNQSPLPPSSLTPLSPDAEPHFPVCVLPHAANWLALTNSSPIK